MDPDRGGMASREVAQGSFETAFALADHDELAALGDDRLGGGDAEIDAFLVNETRHDGEERPTRDRKAELPADHLGVGPLALPVVGLEPRREVGIGAGVPALVDPVEDAGEPALRGSGPQQPVEPTAGFGRHDLAGIGLADGRDVRGVVDPGLQEREVTVELDAVHLEGAVRNPEPSKRLARKQSLIGKIVDRQDARHAPACP